MQRIILTMSLLVRISVATAQENRFPYVKKTIVNFAQSSHQDIGWMHTPAVCKKFRIEQLIMPRIRTLEKNPDYCFTM